MNKQKLKQLPKATSTKATKSTKKNTKRTITTRRQVKKPVQRPKQHLSPKSTIPQPPLAFKFQSISLPTVQTRSFTTSSPSIIPSLQVNTLKFTKTPTFINMTQFDHNTPNFLKTVTIPKRKFSTQPETLDITYIEPSGESVPLRIKPAEHPDDSLMTLAVKNQVDMEGSCDGQLACSTCHCILSQEDFDAFMKLKPPTDEELDMLDTAFGLTPTSRLGCQIPVNMLSKNITLTLPKFTR